MLTLPITYTNFNGKSVTKNFFFNITKAEIALRELESDGTWSETLNAIKGSDKGSVVMPEFKKIIKWVYGEKSADGESFEKSDEIYAKFENSEAWSVLVMNLLTNADFSATFIKGVMPPQNPDGVTPGFRPGANTERPTPPAIGPVEPEVASGPTPLTDPVLPTVQQPVIPEQTNAPLADPVVQAAPAAPVEAPQPEQASPVEVAPTPAENPVQVISTPRTDLAGS